MSSPESLKHHSYRINFRYKKFNHDLQANLYESTLVLTVDDPIPDPLHRNWITIIREINPQYFNIEIMVVKELED